MNRHSLFAKVNRFWLQHQPWFNFLASFSLLIIFTVLAIDFMRAWSTGQMDSVLFQTFKKPADVSGLVPHWVIFLYTTIVGFMWLRTAVRLPARFLDAVLGVGSVRRLAKRLDRMLAKKGRPE